MGTPNNPDSRTKDSGWVEFSLVDFLLPERDQLHVSTLQHEPYEWVRVIRKLIEKHTSRLKYMDGFKELGDEGRHVDDWTMGMAACRPGMVNPKTRVMSIVMHDDLGTKPDADLKYQNHRLFLTDKGEILRVVIHFQGSSTYGVSAKASRADFEIMSDAELISLIKKSPRRVTDLIFILKSSLEKGIERRERQLDALRESLIEIERLGEVVVAERKCENCGHNNYCYLSVCRNCCEHLPF